jgi:hypothetical protein
VKYCFIQRVPFRVPNSDRILWANILAQNQGLTLLIVPKSHKKESHSIYFATENVEEHIFEAVTEHRFDIETMDVVEAAKKLKILGQSFFQADFLNQIRREQEDDL